MTPITVRSPEGEILEHARAHPPDFALDLFAFALYAEKSPLGLDATWDSWVLGGKDARDLWRGEAKVRPERVSEPLIRMVVDAMRMRDRMNRFINRSLDTLHTIGGAYAARGFLKTKRMTMTQVLRESMEAKALSDEQIEKLALDTWESIVEEMQRP